MIDQAALDAAYEESKAATVPMQLGISPGELAGWLRKNLSSIIETHTILHGGENAPLAIAVELVAIGVIAGRNEAGHN